MAGPPRDGDALQDILSAAVDRDRPAWSIAPAGPPEPGRVILARLGLRVALVLVFLAAFDLAVRAALPPRSLLPYMEREFASYTVKVDRFATRPAPDVAFLGNSRVHDGVVPDVFAEGLAQRWGRPARVYNLGLMNAKTEELAALVRSHFPEPAPARVVIGLSGTEIVNAHEFQYASRFLWSGGDCAGWLARTPLRQLQVAHLESFLEGRLCRLWYLFAERDALRTALLERLQDTLHEGFGRPVSSVLRGVRVQVGRHNVGDALADDGYYDDPGQKPNLQRMLSDGEDVRVPPYSQGNVAELQQGADFPLLRDVVRELQARGCRVALVEVPPSPWLQDQCPEFHGELFRTRLEEFAAAAGVTAVVMRPSETHLTDASYVDANHLTRAGALRYSRLLLERLEETGFFD
ncbi:MAG TPA: hypothetical protein VFY71_07180 [Planctomycetota bacterium]|nr:hypothetical protein [Planctomycetota bacterium]